MDGTRLKLRIPKLVGLGIIHRASETQNTIWVPQIHLDSPLASWDGEKQSKKWHEMRRIKIKEEGNLAKFQRQRYI